MHTCIHLQSSRVSIKISDRAKMDPNANECEFTIMGNHGAVKLAEAMVFNCLSAHANTHACIPALTRSPPA